MAPAKIGGILKKAKAGVDAFGLAHNYMDELAEFNKCLKEVGEKRDKALAKKKRNDELVRKHRTILTSWSEDDRYADNPLYQKKLRECYDNKRPLRRAMGLP